MRKPLLCALSFLALAALWAQAPRVSLGAALHEFSPNEARALHLTEGIYVVQVVSGGPAQKAGIQDADIIVSIDGTTVKSYDDVSRILEHHQPGDTIKVAVLRSAVTSKDYEHKTFTVTLGAPPKSQ